MDTAQEGSIMLTWWMYLSKYLTANAFRCTCTRAHLTRNHSGVGSDSSIQIKRAKYNVYSQGKSIVLLSSHSSSHTCKYACVLYIRLSYPPSSTTGKRVWKLRPELCDHRCPLLENGVKRVWPMQYIHVCAHPVHRSGGVVCVGQHWEQAQISQLYSSPWVVLTRERRP